MTDRIDIINGPNLNLLGTREVDIYGSGSLQDIEVMCEKAARAEGFEAVCYQSNHEGALIEHIHNIREATRGIIINAAGLTHTSVALADALRAVEAPVIELHISNVFARESFRHHSFISQSAKAVICGFGLDGYRLAVDGLIAHIKAAK